MKRGENLFKPSQLTILATICDDAPALYIDLQDIAVLLQKSGYDINPDCAKCLLIATIQYVTTSGKDINNIVELLTGETKSIEVLYIKAELKNSKKSSPHNAKGFAKSTPKSNL